MRIAGLLVGLNRLNTDSDLLETGLPAKQAHQESAKTVLFNLVLLALTNLR